jgi:hypothetical protein
LDGFQKAWTVTAVLRIWIQLVLDAGYCFGFIGFLRYRINDSTKIKASKKALAVASVKGGKTKANKSFRGGEANA